MGKYHVEAAWLEADYTASEAGTLRLSFRKGYAVIGGRLPPGCYMRDVAAGSSLRLEARTVVLDFPSRATC